VRRSDPVEREYVDAFRIRRTIGPARLRGVLAAMGLAPGEDGLGQGMPDPVRVSRREGERVAPPAELVLEDGSSLGVVRRLPAGLPHGYHTLLRDAGRQLLLVPPPHARLPVGRTWGWAAQLYATRSTASWGIGDLADLRAVAAWSAPLGAAYLLLNPLNAPNPGPDPDPSPYYPSTRRFRDPIYLRIEEVPGADLLHDELAELAAEGRALNADRRIDRGRVRALKLSALERIWRLQADSAGGTGLQAFRASQGPALNGWATFAAISERHGPGWRSWPEPLRDPSSSAVARVAAAAGDRVAFHEWLQWQLDEQLRRAAESSVRLVADLPVGFDPGGFDAWDWQAEVAAGAAVGAPPDRFNPIGQAWGLPPFIPHRLRAAGYRPFIETVRAALRHAGGLRIDHVLGLFRMWWVPNGAIPADGAYVRYPVDELLAILAIESERSDAIVIGEDLGTVGAGVRRTLRAGGIMSTRLAYFERRLDAIPHLAQASVTTHDLPTVAGAWSGRDTAELAAAGIPFSKAAEAGLRRRLAAVSGMPAAAPSADVILAVHAAVAASPAALVTATLEDALGVVERTNVPGTSPPQRVNWSLALPAPVEQLRTHPLADALARTLAARAAPLSPAEAPGAG
jgi:4-alpha-glucanotransferase